MFAHGTKDVANPAIASGGPYEPLATVDATQTSYVDDAAAPNETYWYVVTFEYMDANPPGPVYPVASPVAGVAPYSSAAGATACCPGDGAFWVDSGPTAPQLAQWIMGTNATVSNARYTGAPAAIGIFGGGNSVGLNGHQFPFDHGVILSSGWITNALGPNDDSGEGGDLHTNGDADLDALVDGTGTADAAVLEFDIVSTNSFQLQIQYVFASEEYPEYAGSKYNDLTAIFVTTNQVGTNWINSLATDIALVPNTAQPIAVNSVNGGCVSDTYEGYDTPAKPQYYVDNYDPHYSAVPPYAASAPVYNLQYDGFTIELTAQATVSANVTNHVKIAIADYGDGTLDSAVFLKTQSFPCPQ